MSKIVHRTISFATLQLTIILKTYNKIVKKKTLEKEYNFYRIKDLVKKLHPSISRVDDK